MVKITIKYNAKLIFLHLHSLPHTKLPNTCHKTKALQKREKKTKVTIEHNKKATSISINNGY